MKLPALLLAIVGACVPADEPEVGTTRQDIARLNGIYLNGIYLNGIYLNGIYLNGIYLNGIYLNGTELGAVLDDGTVLGPDAFVGAELTGTMSDGTTIRLRVDAVSPHDQHDDITTYTLSYEADADNTNTDDTAGGGKTRDNVEKVAPRWLPLCGSDDDGRPVAGFPVAGRWDNETGAKLEDPEAFTFACQGAAIAKCAEWGYKPWVDGFADYHQSCTRMVRADYCGDGTPWTVNGTAIDVYDSVVINPVAEPAWPHEAQWTPNGARCLSAQRVRWFEVDGSSIDPPCLGELALNLCDDGDALGSGALQGTRFCNPDDPDQPCDPNGHGDLVIALSVN